VNTQTGNLLMFAVSLLAAVCSLCLYVPAVLYRARAGSRSLLGRYSRSWYWVRWPW